MTQRMQLQSACPPHDHDYHELCFIWAGEARHRTDDGDEHLSGCSVVVMPPGAVHAFECVRSLQVTNLYYLAPWLLHDLRNLWEEDGVAPLFLADTLFPQLGAARPWSLRLDRRVAAQCRHELAALEGELAREAPSLVFLKACLLKTQILLTRAARHGDAQSRRWSFRPEVWQVLHGIEQRIADGEPLNLGQVARTVHLVPDALARVFRAATGESPNEHFQRRRVQTACALLLDPATDITRVGLQLGFTDTAHFCRTFRRIIGCSPGAYRRRYCLHAHA